MFEVLGQFNPSVGYDQSWRQKTEKNKVPHIAVFQLQSGNLFINIWEFTHTGAVMVIQGLERKHFQFYLLFALQSSAFMSPYF